MLLLSQLLILVRSYGDRVYVCKSCYSKITQIKLSYTEVISICIIAISEINSNYNSLSKSVDSDEVIIVKLQKGRVPWACTF